jgi:hypothetical protein
MVGLNAMSGDFLIKTAVKLGYDSTKYNRFRKSTYKFSAAER